MGIYRKARKLWLFPSMVSGLFLLEARKLLHAQREGEITWETDILREKDRCID